MYGGDCSNRGVDTAQAGEGWHHASELVCLLPLRAIVVMQPKPLTSGPVPLPLSALGASHGYDTGYVVLRSLLS
jgi:hypothetical protein